MEIISETVIFGSAWRSSATTPATFGQAMEVPLFVPHPPPARELVTSSPGEEIWGLIKVVPFQVLGPFEEK